ncbi:MAG: hypothetical protein Q8P59_08815 [Dehalococcoidia bacterium]|nr:hypothetical protein [Dehalococcoidia bacterium]
MTRHVYQVDISAKRSLAWMPACAGMTLAAAMADGRGNLCTPQCLEAGSSRFLAAAYPRLSVQTP